MIDKHDRAVLARLKSDGCSGRELMRVWRSLPGPAPPPTLEQQIKEAQARVAEEHEKAKTCERMIARASPPKQDHFRRFRLFFLRHAERKLEALLAAQAASIDRVEPVTS